MAALLGAAACGDGGKARSIKVVIAEYSKDHTRPFWQGLAEQYTKQTGVKVELQVIDWNSIDQQVSTMIQNNQPPDVLNLNSFSSYAKDGLLYSADEVLSPKTREDFLDAFARGGEYQGKLYGFPILVERARLLLQQGPLRQGGRRGAAQDLGRVRADRQRRSRPSASGVIGYALPLGPEEAQAEWSIWMWNNGGDWKTGEQWTINSDKNVRDARLPRRARQHAQGDAGQSRARPTAPTAPSSSSRTARSAWSWASARSPRSSTPRAR